MAITSFARIVAKGRIIKNLDRFISLSKKYDFGMNIKAEISIVRSVTPVVIMTKLFFENIKSKNNPAVMNDTDKIIVL